MCFIFFLLLNDVDEFHFFRPFFHIFVAFCSHFFLNVLILRGTNYEAVFLS